MSAVVHLGARSYRLSQPLSLPNHITLMGEGDVSTLLFELSGPKGTDWRSHCNQSAAVEVRGANSALRDFSLVLSSPPYFPTAAVWMVENASNFTLAGLTITLAGANVSNALRADGDGFELGNTTISQPGSCECE